MEEHVIDDIVDYLDDLGSRAEVLRVVENALSFYREFDELFTRASMTKLAGDAKEIAGLVADLESKLASTKLLTDFLFTPPFARIATSVPDPTPRADSLFAERTTYKENVLGSLRRMRLDCERVLAEAGDRKQPGPEFDRAQRFCAKLAYGLMTSFSTKPISGYGDGAYHRVASLLYEALTGRKEVDLKRHCDTVQKAPPPIERSAGLSQ